MPDTNYDGLEDELAILSLPALALEDEEALGLDELDLEEWRVKSDRLDHVTSSPDLSELELASEALDGLALEGTVWTADNDTDASLFDVEELTPVRDEYGWAEGGEMLGIEELGIEFEAEGEPEGPPGQRAEKTDRDSDLSPAMFDDDDATHLPALERLDDMDGVNFELDLAGEDEIDFQSLGIAGDLE
ncbi:MAG: hypothetical protein AAF355_02920 [Myxococcota bacterium]